jgi:hypothetical protein
MRTPPSNPSFLSVRSPRATQITAAESQSPGPLTLFGAKKNLAFVHFFLDSEFT